MNNKRLAIRICSIGFLLVAILTNGGCSGISSPTANAQWGALNVISGDFVLPTGDSFYGRAVGQFWRGADVGLPPLQADSVNVNGVRLRYNGTLAASINDSLKWYTDSTYIWHIGGTSDIDSFIDSSFRPAQLRLSAPAPGDNVSRSSGFQLTWSPAVSSSTIDIEVDGAGSKYNTILGLKDVGHAIITADQIPVVPSGLITINLYRTTVKNRQIGTKGYVMTCQTQSAVRVNLTD